MATDAAKHTVPAGTDGMRRQNLLDLSLSIHDIVPVANATERDSVFAALVAAGRVPASAPVIVDRLDTGQLERRAGSTWVPIGTTRQLAAAALPSDSGAVGTTEMAVLTANVVSVNGKVRITVSGRLLFSDVTTQGRALVRVRDGSATGTVLTSGAKVPDAIGTPGAETITVIGSGTLTPGAHTIVVTLHRDSGSGTVVALAGFEVMVDEVG